MQGALSSAGAVGTDIERITRDTVAIWRDIEALASGTGESAARIAQDTTAVASDYSTLASDAISAASAPAFAALAPISAALRSLSDAVSSVLLDPTQAASAPDGTPLLLSGALQPSAAAVLFAGAAAAAAATLLAPRKREIAPGSFDVDPDLPREYDVEALRSYYASRPVELATRTMEAAAWVGSTGAGILMDRATGKVAENEAMRARQVSG